MNKERDMGRVDGKVVIVTGGAGGIGSATCRKFVAEGARVVIADIDLDAANALAAELGDAAIAELYDAADPASVEAVMRSTVAREGRLDVLHNNHAVTDTMASDTNLIDIPLDTWDRVLSINLRGYMLGCRFAIPHIIGSGGWAIINTVSTAGLFGQIGNVAYSTSKGAIVTLTRNVATEHGRQGLRCNAIAPGVVVTPAIQRVAAGSIELAGRHTVLNRLCQPEDIANLACFLASDESSFITGQIITCDGGLTMKSPRYVDMVPQP